jgi:hypothetical protein
LLVAVLVTVILNQQPKVHDPVATQCRVPPLGRASGDPQLYGQHDRRDLKSQGGLRGRFHRGLRKRAQISAQARWRKAWR